MNILVFDNYDSFTYNLVHLVEKIIHGKVDVFRNDQISLEEIKKYDKIILSPGPGIPVEAGLLIPVIKEYASSKSILGVCLGHQAIGEAFGGKLINLEKVYHGVATKMILVEGSASDETIDSRLTPHASRIPALFKSLPREFDAGRYHSWIVSEENFPTQLEITVRDENNFIMGLRHKQFDVQGVQFHPESVLTPTGEEILRNWLRG